MQGVAAADVHEYVYGFAPANDVGLHDFRHADRGSMLRVKGQDGFLPIGPAVVTRDEWSPDDGYSLRTYLNGEVVQRGGSDDIIWDYRYQLADLCRLITLEPGDVVLTGTPANSRPMAPGDVVEVEIDGLGRLTNPVVDWDVDLDRAGRAARRLAEHPARRARDPRGRGRAARRRGTPRRMSSATFAESITVEALEDDPYAIYARLRQQPPAFVPAVNVWMLTRWADVEHAGAHPELFSAETPSSPVELTFGSPTVLTCDGAVHKELRASIDPKFRPRVVDTYVDGLIEPIADELLDRFAARGSAELMAEYLEPISVLGLGQVLGLGDVDGDTLRRWFAGLAQGATNYECDPAKQAIGDGVAAEIRARLAPLLDRLEREPDDSAISHMLHAGTPRRRSARPRADPAEPARDPARRHAGARARRRVGARGAARRPRADGGGRSGPGRARAARPWRRGCA